MIKLNESKIVTGSIETQAVAELVRSNYWGNQKIKIHREHDYSTSIIKISYIDEEDAIELNIEMKAFTGGYRFVAAAGKKVGDLVWADEPMFLKFSRKDKSTMTPKKYSELIIVAINTFLALLDID